MKTMLSKAVRCPQCGSKNAAGARRCRTCTRPLDTTPGTSNADFEERLWADPVTLRAARQPVSKVLVVAVLVVAAIATNYFWLGKGPSWAHTPEAIPKGADWKTFVGPDAKYRVAMPGDPAITTLTTPVGSVTVAQSWIDDHWDLVQDRHTQAVGAFQAAREHLYSSVIVATAAEPSDLSAAARTLVSGLEPAIVVSELTSHEVAFPSLGRQIDLVGRFDNWPDPYGHGTIRARVVAHDGRAVVLATVTVGADDPALLERIVDDYLSRQSSQVTAP